jgi:hypothetical protein
LLPPETIATSPNASAIGFSNLEGHGRSRNNQMEELKAQIKKESSRAAKLSKEAIAAFTTRDFVTGKALMQQAANAGRNCQNLIEQYNQTSELKNKS